MTQLDQSHTLGLDDLNYDMMDVLEVDEEEVSEEVEVEKEGEIDDPVGTYESEGCANRCRTHNYCVKEDVALCHVWLNVSLDASVGTNQTNDRFWGSSSRLSWSPLRCK